MISRLPLCGLSLKIFWRRGRSPCDRCPFPGDYIVNCIFSIWTHIAWTAVLCMNDSHRNRGMRLVESLAICSADFITSRIFFGKLCIEEISNISCSYNNHSKEEICNVGSRVIFLRLLIFISKWKSQSVLIIARNINNE